MPVNYNKAEFKASYGLSGQLPASDRTEIVFSGRSNVGKSSIINKLCSRKNLARVSQTPGKTATINFYSVDNIYFVDLPGYGYAKVSQNERMRWNDLINSYFNNERSCAVLFQLLDCRHKPSEDDIVMLEYLQHYNIPYYVILTKADKLKKTELKTKASEFINICAGYGCKGVLLTSSQSGYGIQDVKDVIESTISDANGI